MFKTEETRRIRLKGGTRVHDVPVPHSRPMATTCGKRVKLFDARGRILDLPLSGMDSVTVTCPACLRATAA
ncbi:hypothetical protein [Streptomyces sp. NPDC085596]|uniref:hypothetical protein n=1 Tax=Streptomyces sp. NPDC085596 TaxID=3365731 RepID=UPI0037D78B72